MMHDKIDDIIGRQEELLRAALAKATVAHANSSSPATEKGLRSARRALDEYLASQQASEQTVLPSRAAAYGWLQEHYNIAIKYRAFNGHCSDGYTVPGDPGRSRYNIPHKQGRYAQADLDIYARNMGFQPLHDAKSASPADDTNVAEQLKQETLRKLRDENDRRAGLYLLKSDEEQRDARILAYLKTDLESFGITLVEEIAAACQAGQTTAECLILYQDFVADMFDRHARAGGVWVDSETTEEEPV